MRYYECTDMERIRRTEIPKDRKIKMILDTDTYNEIDDQFAIFYALASEDRIDLKGITAELFFNARSVSPADGMEKSYQEIKKILKLAGRESDGFAFRGCTEPMQSKDQPGESEAVDFIIWTALARTKEDPLFVVGIGSSTNIASAIVKEPEIMDRIVVLWLGGNTHDWPDNEEFNLSQDPIAGSIVFDCGVPLIQLPASGVTSFLLTSMPELEACLGGVNAIGDYLVENVAAYEEDHFAWSKAIWDIGAIGVLIDPEWTVQKICPSPVIAAPNRYAFDPRRHLIRSVCTMDRDKVFRDLFTKIRNMQ